MNKINDNAEMVGGRIKSIFRASIVAIIVNVSIGIFKLMVGFITKSIAITMDAINNFTDAGSSFITMLSTGLASKDADKKHPFGYGRTEYLGTLLIAVLILYAGVTAFVEAVKSIINPETAEYSAVTLAIVIVAIFAKVALTIYITRVGKKVNSDSLIAAGKESTGDIAISIATVAAAFIYIITDLSVEAYLAAGIALFIIKAGVDVLIETVSKLLGTGADASIVVDIKKAIAEYDEVAGAYDLVLHNYGPDAYLGSVHIEVEDTMPISRLDALTREIQEDIVKRFGVYLSAIGVYSVNTKDAATIAIREDVKTIVMATEYVKQSHGFYLDTDKKTMRFDIVVSFAAGDRRIVYQEVVKKIKNKYPDYSVIVGMDLDYNEI